MTNMHSPYCLNVAQVIVFLFHNFLILIDSPSTSVIVFKARLKRDVLRRVLTIALVFTQLVENLRVGVQYLRYTAHVPSQLRLRLVCAAILFSIHRNNYVVVFHGLCIF